MCYPTESTEWPETIPKPIIRLLDHFFTLVDTNSDTVGEALAKEIFTPDGKFTATYGTFEGYDGMYFSTTNITCLPPVIFHHRTLQNTMWASIDKSSSHFEKSSRCLAIRSI